MHGQNDLETETDSSKKALFENTGQDEGCMDRKQKSIPAMW